MGISISYKGKLSDPTVVSELVSDLTVKAKAAGWLCKTMDELVAEGLVTCEGLAGITLYPHRECEPLHFHFDREGTFTNHMYYGLLTDTKKADMIRQALAESMALTRTLTQGSGKEARRPSRDDANAGGPRISIGLPGLPETGGSAFFKEGSHYNWTKTQFAGPKVHVAVCAILRYVKERYAPGLEVADDSRYFIDGNYERLEGELAYVDRIASLTTQAIETVAASGKGPMTLDAFVSRINEELAEAKNKLH